jgi:hypothetical protein
MVRLLHFTLNNSKQEKHSLKRVSLVLSSGGSMIRRKSGLEIDYLFSLSHVVPFFPLSSSSFISFPSLLPYSPFFLPFFLPPPSSSTIFSLPPPMCKQAQEA